MSLLPVFAPRPIFQQQRLAHSYVLARDARLAHINRHSKYLCDYVYVMCEEIDTLRAVMAGTDKKVIPSICCDSFGFPSEDGKPVNFSEFPAPATRDPRTFVASPRYQAYLDFVQEHLSEFPYVLLGNGGPELFMDYQAGEPGARGAIDGMEHLMRRFPWAAEKAIFSPMDWVFGHEAWPFDNAQDRPFDNAQDRPFDGAQDRRMANGGGDTPVRKYCVAHRTPVLIFTGFCFLYPDFRTMQRFGYQARAPGEYNFQFAPRGPGSYPHTYFRRYFEGMTAWSGIGFARGARLGHYQGLRNLGLHGCLFFVPQDDSAESQADMEAYVAAAQDGDWPRDHEPWRPPITSAEAPRRFRPANRRM